MKAQLPLEEKERLERLRSLRVLDSFSESEYEDLVVAASVLMDVPIAVITLVDSDRQWFKAKVGLDTCETSRDIAFCAHAILQSEPLVVPDATLDDRFADNPLVTGDFHLRFYAGVPIVVGGYAMGTLCCIDKVPRTPSERHVEALAALARQVSALLRARSESARLRESEERLERAEEAALQSARRFEQLFAGLPVACFTYDSEGKIQEWNAAAESLWGVPAHQAFHKPVCGTAVGGENGAYMGDVVRRVFAGETVQGRERQETMRDGSKKWILSSTIPLRDGSGKISGAVSANVDLTERRWAEQQLAEKGERLRTVIASLHEGLVVQDEEGKVVLWNASAERILGLSGDQISGRTSFDPTWRATYEDGSECPGAEHPIAKALKTGTTQQSQILGVQRSDGETRWLKVNAAPIISNALGKTTAAVASFLDVTERIEHQRKIGDQLQQIQKYSAELESANSRLEALATTDGLTGLKNHRHFQDFLGRKIEHCQAARIPLTIALVDVDHFKAYNDDFGHQAGDAVLKRFATTLLSIAGEGDLVARYGGEEFVVVMPGLGEEDALTKIEQMRKAVAHQSFPYRSVTASFGIASLSEVLRDATGLIKAADDALYEGKADGRNRVRLWKKGERPHAGAFALST